MIEMYFLFFTFILSIYGMETWAYVVATTLEKKRYFRFLWFSVFRFLFICFPFSLFYDVFYIQFSLSLSFYLIFTYFCCFSFTFLFQSFSFHFFFYCFTYSTFFINIHPYVVFSHTTVICSILFMCMCTCR